MGIRLGDARGIKERDNRAIRPGPEIKGSIARRKGGEEVRSTSMPTAVEIRIADAAAYRSRSIQEAGAEARRSGAQGSGIPEEIDFALLLGETETLTGEAIPKERGRPVAGGEGGGWGLDGRSSPLTAFGSFPPGVPGVVLGMDHLEVARCSRGEDGSCEISPDREAFARLAVSRETCHPTAESSTELELGTFTDQRPDGAAYPEPLTEGTKIPLGMTRASEAETVLSTGYMASSGEAGSAAEPEPPLNWFSGGAGKEAHDGRQHGETQQGSSPGARPLPRSPVVGQPWISEVKAGCGGVERQGSAGTSPTRETTSLGELSTADGDHLVAGNKWGSEVVSATLGSPAGEASLSPRFPSGAAEGGSEGTVAEPPPAVAWGSHGDLAAVEVEPQVQPPLLKGESSGPAKTASLRWQGILDRVIETVRLAKDGEITQARVRLHPPQLGSLKVEAEWSGALKLRLEVQNPLVLRELESGLSDLRQHLLSLGLPLQELQLQLGEGTGRGTAHRGEGEISRGPTSVVEDRGRAAAPRGWRLGALDLVV